MFSMRARTLSGLSSFLDCSFWFSGSRYPSAHCPSPRFCRGRPERPGPVGAGLVEEVPELLPGAVPGDVVGGVTRGCAPVDETHDALCSPRPLCREVCRRPRARLAAGRPGGPGQTDHAPRAAEVHVASDHEVHRRCGADHGPSLTARTRSPQTRIL